MFIFLVKFQNCIIQTEGLSTKFLKCPVLLHLSISELKKIWKFCNFGCKLSRCVGLSAICVNCRGVRENHKLRVKNIMWGPRTCSISVPIMLPKSMTIIISNDKYKITIRNAIIVKRTIKYMETTSFVQFKLIFVTHYIKPIAATFAEFL